MTLIPDLIIIQINTTGEANKSIRRGIEITPARCFTAVMNIMAIFTSHAQDDHRATIIKCDSLDVVTECSMRRSSFATSLNVLIMTSSTIIDFQITEEPDLDQRSNRERFPHQQIVVQGRRQCQWRRVVRPVSRHESSNRGVPQEFPRRLNFLPR